jgi:DNA primase
MYTDDSVNRVREVAIHDIVNRRVPLKKGSGGRWEACCPFHDENTPSFSIDTVKNKWNCYGGCASGGDGISFVMQYDSVEFLQAVSMIANEQGMTLDVVDDGKTPEQRKEETDTKKNALKLLQDCADWYYEQRELSTFAKDYLGARGLSAATIEKWRIGFAPDAWDFVKNRAIDSGRYPIAEQLALVKHKDEKHYDFFRNRIMFPICNFVGDVIGFGGRSLDPEEKKYKYLNSTESFIFHKEEALFGWHHASQAIKKQDECYLTEGYMDVIMPHQMGVENVVATLGTALNRFQVQKIKRLTDKITLVRDNDAAGIKATKRDMELCLREGMHVKVLVMPDGIKDFDLLVKNEGMPAA